MLRNKNPPCFLVRLQERRQKNYIKKTKRNKKLCNVVCFLMVDVLECSAMVELQKPEKILLNHHFERKKTVYWICGFFSPRMLASEGLLFTSFFGGFPPGFQPPQSCHPMKATTLFRRPPSASQAPGGRVPAVYRGSYPPEVENSR